MNLPLKIQKTKTLNVKPNGRSSDFVTPNFILGCNAGCSNTYCYTRRFGRKHIYINENLEKILSVIDKHRLTLSKKVSNQTDSKYWTYDIACDTDIVYHWKDYDWNKVLDYFQDTPDIKATFATKFCSNLLANRQVIDDKLRIRFSIMPQYLSNILERNTSTFLDKLKYIEKFLKSGWDVHINLSPIIITDRWLEDYEYLLKEINKLYPDILFECIFLTHNEYLHKLNWSEHRYMEESLIWNPEIQETKLSEYGGVNLRYNHILKANYIKQFKEVFTNYFNENQIRYIF